MGAEVHCPGTRQHSRTCLWAFVSPKQNVTRPIGGRDGERVADGVFTITAQPNGDGECKPVKLVGIWSPISCVSLTIKPLNTGKVDRREFESFDGLKARFESGLVRVRQSGQHCYLGFRAG